jgi:selenide,water dikinase
MSSQLNARPGVVKPLRDLLLVGAGHAHVQVLRSFLMRPPADCRVTLVVDRPIAVYSGMVPGFIAGQYREEELEIDPLPLARRAGARVVYGRVLRVDAAERRVHVEGRASLHYDIASFNIGSTVAGLDLPGVREHAVPTRPIGRFNSRVEGIVEAARARREQDSSSPFRVMVSGGGAGGVEVAACLDARLRSLGLAPEVTLVHAGERLMTGYGEAVARRVEAALVRRGIRIEKQRKVVAVQADSVSFEDGGSLPFDSLLWVTGAAAQPLFSHSDLPVDARGFIKVRGTLQVDGHDELFAVGDCASLIEYPGTPKAGVYAVREGPYLTDNLRARLSGHALRRYRPQSDFLTLLNLGDGTAIGVKKGIAFEGRWVMAWKDRIDRKFMRGFQLLAADGSDGPATAMLPPMNPAMDMVCGGCAAKLGQTALERALARLDPPPAAPEVLIGLDEADDVAAYAIEGGGTLVVSVDFFRAFTDDPYLVGRIAAENALSDIDAKGVTPRWAQALVAVPMAADEDEGGEVLYQVLAGARSVFDARGVRLLGGHTSKSMDLEVGFSVQGHAAAGATLPRRRGHLVPGQQLVLTRALGTGVLFHADMAGRARGPWMAAALASMLRGNGGARGVASLAGASTDITGFGLAGHLISMLGGGECAARIHVSRLPALPGAVELLLRGERSTFHPENARMSKALAIDPAARTLPQMELIFDPQTAGGLLLALDAADVEQSLAQLRAAGYAEAVVIGEITAAREDGAAAEILP